MKPPITRAVFLFAAGLWVAAAVARKTKPFSTNNGGESGQLHGYWREGLRNRSDVPLCSLPDVFAFKEATLHSGVWKLSLDDMRSPSCKRSFEAADPIEPRCELLRVNAQQARECLNGKHIVLIGDSLTRYQYKSLSVLIAYGENPDPTGRNPNHPANRWMRTAGGCTPYDGNVRCDRFRDPFRLYETLHDNKYLSVHGVNITLLGLYNVARGHAPMGFFRRDKSIKYIEQEIPIDKSRGDWEGDLINLSGEISKYFGQVDAVFVNSGLWNLTVFETVESAMQQLRSVEPLVRGGRKPIWITSTPVLNNARDKERMLDPSRQVTPGYLAAQALGWDILDRCGIATSLIVHALERGIALQQVYNDRVHFHPFVSQEFNNVLLNMLCAVH